MVKIGFECAVDDSACHTVFFYAIPLLACVTTCYNFSAPLPAIRRIRKYFSLELRKRGSSKSIPPLVNPLPFALQLTDGVVWFVYSLVINDAYMSFTGIVGMTSALLYLVYMHCLGWHYILDRMPGRDLALSDNIPMESNSDPPRLREDEESAGNELVLNVAKQPKRIYRQLEHSLILALAGPMLAMTALTISFYIPSVGELSPKISLIGVVAAITHSLFYSAPVTLSMHALLTHPAHVRNLFNMRLALVRTLNGILWMLFGCALGNAFIVAAYVVATVCGIWQVAVLLYLHQYHLAGSQLPAVTPAPVPSTITNPDNKNT